MDVEEGKLRKLIDNLLIVCEKELFDVKKDLDFACRVHVDTSQIGKRNSFIRKICKTMEDFNE